MWIWSVYLFFSIAPAKRVQANGLIVYDKKIFRTTLTMGSVVKGNKTHIYLSIRFLSEHSNDLQVI